MAKKKALIRKPYVLSAQMSTTGNGTPINGGALIAGSSRPFPQEAFNYSLSRPMFLYKLSFSVLRPAGGSDTDSDYDNVSVEIKDQNTDQTLMKDAAPLSTFLNRITRENLLAPARIPMQAKGSGLLVKPSVLPGAVGSPATPVATV